MRENLFPVLEASDACRSMTTAVDESDQRPRIVATSVWRSLEAMRELVGPDGVILEDAERFLAGEPTVDHHEVLDDRDWSG